MKMILFGYFYPFYDNSDTGIFDFERTHLSDAEAKNRHISSFIDSIATTGTFDCATEYILVYDITGRLVKNVSNGENISLDISSWASGMYIVRCGRHMVKFIKHTSPNR